jgi:hypothetical protein
MNGTQLLLRGQQGVRGIDAGEDLLAQQRRDLLIFHGHGKTPLICMLIFYKIIPNLYCIFNWQNIKIQIYVLYHMDKGKKKESIYREILFRSWKLSVFPCFVQHHEVFFHRIPG